MITARALSELKVNGEIVGYKLKDETGKEMDIKSSAIIDALNRKVINIPNLKITEFGKLVMIEEQNTNTVKNEVKPEIKENIVQSKSENDTKLDRMHYLIDVLNKASKAYYADAHEIMSNFEYDKLYDELLQLEKETGTVLGNSPSQNVGYEVVSKLPKETHETPMLSLDKTKDRESLISWLNGKEGLLSWKMDGLTVVLTYENGKFIKGVTRGNGEIGEVVTPNVKQFKNVPRQIAFQGKLVLRGEAIITYSSFDKINSKIVLDDEKYKNPRNLCSGSVRQLDSSVTAQRDVMWYAFEVVEANGANFGDDYEKQLQWLKIQGFNTVEYEVVTPGTILGAIERFSNKVKTNDVPTDGLVLTFKDRAYGRSLGRTSKFPRHSIAFKWQDETAVSTIEYIEWSPSRTGLINPVAVFKPVDIEGSTVQRASVHNVSIFADLELGYGDRVEVYKANMIIPQISENLDRTATCEIPAFCPCCGCETEVHEDDKSGVLTLWCMNANCEAKGNRLFEHFVTRDAMNIDGISTATLVTFLELGIIDDLPSIFHLAEHQDEIVNLEGFGFKSFYNMINAIEKARNVKLANLIYALGIPNIGLSTSKLICKNFGYDMKSTVTASYNDLIQIEGIGDVIAQSFVDYFADKNNADQFVRLIKEVNLIEEKVSTDTSMAGVTICVTGDVYIFPNRRAVKEIVENMGGKLTGSVSRSTSYLVTNDTTSGSNKNKAAQSYGIPILTEKEFIDKFNIQL